MPSDYFDDDNNKKGQAAAQEEDGSNLWARYTHDIEKINPVNVAGRTPEPADKKPGSGTPVEKVAAVVPQQYRMTRVENFEIGLREWSGEPDGAADGAAESSRSKGQIDKRTAMRLKRGQIPIDARIDLHGLYQEQARVSLYRFLEQSWGRGDRCVLVITGKGQLVFEGDKADANTPGVIKRSFKGWLKAEPYASMILKIEQAHIKDGGAGAYYILLRRHR